MWLDDGDTKVVVASDRQVYVVKTSIAIWNICTMQMFKKTYERWGLKYGDGKPRIETCGGE
jgi:hypothetical protein